MISKMRQKLGQIYGMVVMIRYRTGQKSLVHCVMMTVGDSLMQTQDVFSHHLFVL